MAELDDDAIRNAASELEAQDADLPFGITIKPDYDHKGILVGNDTLGFFISGNTISHGEHLNAYRSAMKQLCAILADPKATEECLTVDWTEIDKRTKEWTAELKAERIAKENSQCQN